VYNYLKPVDKYDIKVVSWYQNLGVFRSADMGILGLFGYPKNNGLLLLGVVSYARYYERLP
jgi:hypothetical protein